MTDTKNAPAWPAAPAAGWKPALTAGGIHLWRTDLDSPPRLLAERAATVAADERERAARFHFSEHRDRFIAGRGLLRVLLAPYLERPAVMLRFEQGPHGKPALAGEEAGAGLHFNLAHGGGRALYAVARREVGMDLECLDRTVSCLAIAERICTPRVSFRQRCKARPLGRERRRRRGRRSHAGGLGWVGKAGWVRFGAVQSAAGSASARASASV